MVLDGTEGDMPKAPLDFMKRFRAVLVEEERALADRERAAQMKKHARVASELHAAGKLAEADAELRKAEALAKAPTRGK